MTHYISGTSQVARPRTAGGEAPTNDVSGYGIVGRSQIARPCPDGPAAPANDPSGYRVHGHAIWRPPCEEAGCGHCSTDGLYDDFDRDVAEDWGTSTPTLQTYQNYNTSGGSFSVADGVGHIDLTATDVNIVKVQMPEFCGWTQPTGFVMRFDFLTGAVVDGGTRHLQLATLYPTTVWQVLLTIDNSATGQLEIDSDPGYNSADKTDWVADTWYSVKVEYDPGSFFGLKVWLRADSEPADWSIYLLGDVAGALSGGLQLEANGGGTEYSFAIDNLSFCCDTSPGNSCGWQGPGS